MPARSDNVTPSATERAAAARLRASERLAVAMADVFLPEDARLDDRTRLALADRLGRLVGGLEAELRRQAARLLAARGAEAAAASLQGSRAGLALERLTRAGLLRDEALVEELLAQTQLALTAQAMPAAGGEDASLLVRLAAVPDRVVAAAAQALLVADSREEAMLPAELHHRLVWQVAAAIRPDPSDAETDRAIAEAATRSLAAYDEGERPEAVAARLAAAIDARPDELAPLLLEALGDRRPGLFTAVLAQAVGIDTAQLRTVVLEPEGERLWLALRAARLDRQTIARIALTLADADPRRDIEGFADQLDRIAAVEPADARLALAPETLNPAFRAAIGALARSIAR
jgi:hypothetical protein